MGKGDERRPRSVTKETYDKNYEAAFGCQDSKGPDQEADANGGHGTEDCSHRTGGIEEGSGGHREGST